MSDQWEYVESLFLTALEYAPVERELWLGRLAQEEPDIAGEVTRLLRAYEEADDFLRRPCTFPTDFLDDLEAEPYRFFPGDVLCERFRIVHPIGKGGMGEVYKAWEQEASEYVALKTLRLGILPHKDATSRFREEPRLGRKVTHPNVCRIHGSFRHQVSEGDFISIVSMELLQGQTLAEYLKEKGRLKAEEALPLARQITHGLDAIHAANIVHRDLKPANLILVAGAAHAAAVGGSSGGPDGNKSNANFQIKITDFGIAGMIPDPLSPYLPSEASRFLGTPAYMAPEQLEQGEASIRSDIYALGLILYQMVTGEKPFAGAAWKRVTSDPPSPRKAAPGLPENWNKTILCCLERNPAHRFQNAQAVLNSLEGATPPALPRKPLSLRFKRAARSRSGLLTIFFLLSVSLATGIYRYFYQRPEIPPGTMVLVTDIETPDPRLSGITVVLKELLAQSAHFEVEQPEKIAAVLKLMNREPEKPMDERAAREVALRSRARWVVSGTLSTGTLSSGLGGLELTIKVQHPISPYFPGVSRQQSFLATDEKDLRDHILPSASTWIRRLAGEQESDLALQDRPVEEITTPSWEALKLYSEAEKKIMAQEKTSLKKKDEEENQEKKNEKENRNAALLLLQEAVQADPDFAMAHSRMADILIYQRRYNEGYAEWKKAFDLVSKRTLTNRESLRIQGQYYEDTGDYIAAEKKFEQYKIHYPNDYYAWFYWGSALNAMERYDSAIDAFSHAADLKKDDYVARSHMAMTYMLQGRFSEAALEIDRVAKLNRDNGLWLAANADFLQHKYDSAIAKALLLRKSGSDNNQSRSYDLLGKFLAELGRYEEAIAVYQQGIKFDQGHGYELVAGEADKKISLSYLYFRKEEFAQCQEEAAQAVTLDSSPHRLLGAGTLLARSGNPGEADQLIGKLESAPDVPRVRLAADRLKGEVALARLQWKQAILYFQEAAAIARPSENQAYLANALAAGDKAEKANTVLRELAKRPARILMYRDNDFPGLYADSLFPLIQHSDINQKADFCNLTTEYLQLRDKASPWLEAKEVSFVRKKNEQVCR